MNETRHGPLLLNGPEDVDFVCQHLALACEFSGLWTGDARVEMNWDRAPSWVVRVSTDRGPVVDIYPGQPASLLIAALRAVRETR